MPRVRSGPGCTSLCTWLASVPRRDLGTLAGRARCRRRRCSPCCFTCSHLFGWTDQLIGTAQVKLEDLQDKCVVHKAYNVSTQAAGRTGAARDSSAREYRRQGRGMWVAERGEYRRRGADWG